MYWLAFVGSVALPVAVHVVTTAAKVRLRSVLAGVTLSVYLGAFLIHVGWVTGGDEGPWNQWWFSGSFLAIGVLSIMAGAMALASRWSGAPRRILLLASALALPVVPACLFITLLLFGPWVLIAMAPPAIFLVAAVKK